MTISPPAKVKPYDCGDVEVLASNLDKLDLSIDVHWVSDDFFQFLEDKKTMAQRMKKEVGITLKPLTGDEKWACMLKPYGAKGYAWLLESQEFVMKIGNWLEPIDRPSVFVEIRSETLWRLGPEKARDRIVNILKGQSKGCLIESIRPSRVDLCVDVLMPDHIWDVDLIKYKVTRARSSAIYFHYDDVKGISIGRGAISARLYDKPLEIRQKSNKYWMYPIWGLKEDEIPEDHRIVRVEFQLRREAITQLGIDSLGDLLEHPHNLWGYCTKKWLKFRSNPGAHHTMRKTFAWWKAIQNGYQGVKDPQPLIRFKAIQCDYEKMVSQVDGLLSSMEAIIMEMYNPQGGIQPARSIALQGFCRTADAIGKDSMRFMETVNEKRIKYKRSKEKALSVHERRILLGLPCNLNLNNRKEK